MINLVINIIIEKSYYYWINDNDWIINPLGVNNIVIFWHRSSEKTGFSNQPLPGGGGSVSDVYI